MRNLVFGVGVYKKGKYVSWVDGKNTKEYALWRDMLRRGYCMKLQEKHPTYKGCTVSEEFKNFQMFAEWCQDQIGFGNVGWDLDKDILFRGNKQYNRDTCVFIPKEVNIVVTDSVKLNQGVHFCKEKGKYRLRLTMNGVHKHLGYFKTINEGWEASKHHRELRLKNLAETYKLDIDPRAYNSLVNWVI